MCYFHMTYPDPAAEADGQDDETNPNPAALQFHGDRFVRFVPAPTGAMKHVRGFPGPPAEADMLDISGKNIVSANHS